jgi:hypothetical protein
MNLETRDKHFVYTKQLSGRVKRGMSIDSAVHDLYEFTFNMSYSKEHNPDPDTDDPNYVFVLNILEDTMNSIRGQYSETNLYDKIMFAKKSTKISLEICSLLFSYVEKEVKDDLFGNDSDPIGEIDPDTGFELE